MIQTIHSGLAAALIASPLILSAQDADPAAEAPAPDPSTIKKHSSYGIGYRTGGEFGQQYGSFGMTVEEIERESFMKGFLDGFQGADPAIPDEQVQAAVQALGDLLQKREQQIAARNLEEGQAFLAKNKNEDGIQTLDSGLQYKVLKPGQGETYSKPGEGEPTKQFQVRYEGSLLDGSTFDASPEGQAVTMNLQVIDGMKEALTTMPVGATWRLFIPSDLAYGEQRRSSEIGPNSTLIFDVELLAIEDAPAPQQGGLPFPLPGQ
jgi:FKBP-type peptidyl-prolyl cis-trans isomerase